MFPASLALLLLGCFAWAGNAHAAAEGRPVEYQHGDTILEGYLAYDPDLPGKRPGILVVHEWKGLNDYARRRANQLAEMGYVAFAADMYGKGIVAKDHEEAGRLSGVYRKDRQLTRERIKAALDVLAGHPMTDPQKLGAIGYCFGGMAVIELARSGADIDGVVSFHGTLETPVPAKRGEVKAKVLVLTGADDPHIKQDQVAAFEKEMKEAGVDYKVVVYPGAVHSFTVPEAGNDPAKGAAYNEQADQSSWKEMTMFFNQLFREINDPRIKRDTLNKTAQEMDSTLKQTTGR